MGGVGFQEFFVLVFAYIAFRFSQQIKRENPAGLSQALLLLYTQYTALVLITVSIILPGVLSVALELTRKLQVRIIFRLIEYSKGLDSTIPNHEAYQYVFDTLPMFLALVLFNLVHPGRIMPGKESDFPSRKERKHYFKPGSSEDSSTILPRAQPTASDTMPEAIAFQPKGPEAVPTYGYVR